MAIYDEKNRILEVSGSPFERMYQQGTVFKDFRESVLQVVKEIPFAAPSLQNKIPKFVYKLFIQSQGKRFLTPHLPLLKNYQGTDLYEKVQGMTKGMETDLEFLYGINSLEIISSQLPYSLGCSSLAFNADHTEEGHPQLAYNHDFPVSFGPHLFVRRTVPDKGYRSLTLSYPPIMGAIAGLNEKGLAISLNHAFAIDIKPTRALLITMLLQECLERCETVEEAVELIKETPVPNGSMVTLIDKKGNRAVAELSCTKRSFRYPEEGKVLQTFNQYQCSDMAEVEIPLTAKGKWVLKGYDIHQHNIARNKRFHQIIDHSKKYSDEEIQNLLSDHETGEGGYNTICRHHPETADTLSSTILNPVLGRIKIIFGLPCEGNYKEYYLEKKIKAVA